MRVVFVCLGNICRSPAAEAIFVAKAKDADADIEIESAGIGPWHIGDPPHRETRAEAERRGIPVDHLGQQFGPEDFARFDLVVAMDSANVADLVEMAPAQGARDKIVRLGQFAPDAARTGVLDVPDPYGKPQAAFSAMFDQLEPAVAGLLRAVESDSVEEMINAGAQR